MWIADNPERFAGRSVGNGHCVAFVREAANVPHTSTWRKGDKVIKSTPKGTAIATFNDMGRYANATDGSSHTAILIEMNDVGLKVWDQWVGHPTSTRTIRFKKGVGLKVDDGDAYYIIEPIEQA